MIRILVTLGDPAGVGPEVIDAALADFSVPADVEISVIGDRSAGEPGQPSSRSGRAALDALQQAGAQLKAGEAQAVATGPVSKEALQQHGFPFPGQTEFFADLFDIQDFAMCLDGSRLCVVPVTIHIPLAEVASQLDSVSIERSGRLLVAHLQRRGCPSPRIAVAGLNPHAGEGGAFGDEEQRIIAPAIERLNAASLDATFHGPEVPDAVFREAANGGFDGVLAMYHDQGLIPFKLLDFDSGVNLTLGLPVPRTSPDHGTAFSIAGKGIASAGSMRRAIELACQLA